VTRTIDAILHWLKWPVALWVAVGVPQLLRADLALVQAGLRLELLPFWLGLVGYLAVWWTVLRHRGWGRLLPTLLHEVTHALFALLTLHRVVSIHATWSDGGLMQFLGRGNWLITISPYFFPLAILVAAPFLDLLDTAEPVRLALLGVVFGFESAAMWRQVHREQPDLQDVGFLFAAVFLPGALLWSYGTVFSLALGGGRGMTAFVAAQWTVHWRTIGTLLQQGITAIT